MPRQPPYGTHAHATSHVGVYSHTVRYVLFFITEIIAVPILMKQQQKDPISGTPVSPESDEILQQGK